MISNPMDRLAVLDGFDFISSNINVGEYLVSEMQNHNVYALYTTDICFDEKIVFRCCQNRQHLEIEVKKITDCESIFGHADFDIHICPFCKSHIFMFL